MHTSILSCKKGFTLVEVLIAMVILAFGVMAFIALQSASIQAREHSHRLTNATELTSSLLDELMVSDPQTLSNGNDVINVDGVNYSRTWVIESNIPVNSLNRIRVTTQWNEKNKSKSVQLAAVIPQ